MATPEARANSRFTVMSDFAFQTLNPENGRELLQASLRAAAASTRKSFSTQSPTRHAPEANQRGSRGILNDTKNPGPGDA